jgi:hypothetical protein
MNRADFRQLAMIRIREARVLLNAGCFDGAYYLTGYAVEFALKACIAKTTRRSEWPELERVRDSHIHELRRLVVVADLQTLLDNETNLDRIFADHWETVKRWSEKTRYLFNDEAKARTLFKAVTDRQHGVMRWLKNYW